MIRKILVLFICLVLGFTLGVVYISFLPNEDTIISPFVQETLRKFQKKEVIGFLPYWLLDKAKDSYASYFTSLSYFSLTINSDGTIQKKVNDQEEEPGWTSLKKDSVKNILQKARNDGLKTSLVVFNANEKNIDELLSDPVVHGTRLINDITPIMKEYGFDDLNIDIESVIEASQSSQIQFASFLQTVKDGIQNNKLGTLTVDITVMSLFQSQRIHPSDVARIADKVVLMTYDYHYPGSFSAGPVSPLHGSKIDVYNDVSLSLNKSLEFIPAEKLLLGIPLYGYEWQTLQSTPGAAVIPGTGQTASDRRVDDILSNCNLCITGRLPLGDEPYIIFPEETAFHQIFYTDKESIHNRLLLGSSQHIAGAAVWALGYEGKETLKPFKNYLQ